MCWTLLFGFRGLHLQSRSFHRRCRQTKCMDFLALHHRLEDCVARYSGADFEERKGGGTTFCIRGFSKAGWLFRTEQTFFGNNAGNASLGGLTGWRLFLGIVSVIAMLCGFLTLFTTVDPRFEGKEFELVCRTNKRNYGSLLKSFFTTPAMAGIIAQVSGRETPAPILLSPMQLIIINWTSLWQACRCMAFIFGRRQSPCGRFAACTMS